MYRETDRDVQPAGSPPGSEPTFDRHPARERTPVAAHRERDPELLCVRGAYLRLSPSALETMHDVGRFRTVEVADLARFRYARATRDVERDLRDMQSQGLITRRTISMGPRAPALPVVVLTKTGKAALEALHAASGDGMGAPAQRVYAGFVKPNEVRHDAAIYRMFHAERARLERDGATIRRVVLDYELKARVYAPLAKARALGKPELAKLQQDVARANGLTVVNGKIPLPDLRIEYETASGESESVDLELATGHYHGGAMATKARAGFRFYAAGVSASKLAAMLEERDITVAILSL